MLAGLTIAYTLLSALAAGAALDPETARPIEQPSTLFTLVQLLLAVPSAIAGGWTAGVVAGRAPTAHGFALGVLLLVGGMIYQVAQLILGATTDIVTEPIWYLLLLPALGLPSALLGGWLRERQFRRSGRATP